jgi:uncharacterized peroxidase-related enzyme
MLRLSYWTISPDGNRAALALTSHLKRSGLGPTLLDLVYLRVSQINGCTYCVDLHARDLRRAGVEERKLDSLVVWREAPFFSARERAALAWAEAVTRLPETGAPDDIYDALRHLFTDQEIVDLTLGIANMNMLNRVAVSFRRAPIESSMIQAAHG